MNVKIIFIITTITLGVIVAGCSDKFDSLGKEEPVVTKSVDEQESKLAWDYPVRPGTN